MGTRSLVRRVRAAEMRTSLRKRFQDTRQRRNRGRASERFKDPLAHPFSGDASPTSRYGSQGSVCGPHPEDRANPIMEPIPTATIGLHQRIQPVPDDELKRYNPKPMEAPKPTPISFFIKRPLPLDV